MGMLREEASVVQICLVVIEMRFKVTRLPVLTPRTHLAHPHPLRLDLAEDPESNLHQPSDSLAHSFARTAKMWTAS